MVIRSGVLQLNMNSDHNVGAEAYCSQFQSPVFGRCEGFNLWAGNLHKF